MRLIFLKTPLIKPKSHLVPIILDVLAKQSQILKEKDILVITAKIVSLSANRIVSLKKQNLARWIQKEADLVFSQDKFTLTYKQGLFIPNAGIDQSNTKPNTAILYPKNPQTSADNLRRALRKKFQIENLGIIISDSHCQPLRQGVTGVALAYSGFIGVADCRGQKDLFGKKLQVTKRNLADSLAAAANILMGEAAERIPFVIIRDAPVTFTNQKIDSQKEMTMPADQCLFRPLYPKGFREKLTTKKEKPKRKF